MPFTKLFTKQLQLRIKFLLGSLFYLGYAPKALRFSRWKDRVERDLVIPPPAETFASPGKLLQAEARPQGAQLYFERAELEITFLAPDLVRLTWQPGLLPVPYGIVPQDWPPVATELEAAAEGWTVYSLAADSRVLQVDIAPDGSITYRDGQGQVLRREQPPAKPGEGWTHRTELHPEEAIYGLGERATPLNLRLARETEDDQPTNRPKRFRMWNYDAAGKYDAGADPMYICIPLYLGLHHQGSYLAFYENSFDAWFQFGDVDENQAENSAKNNKGNITTAEFTGGALRYYVASGSPAQLLERYSQLTGRAPLPPLWALGYHQSHWGYETEAAVRATYQGFEQHNLPLSVIHLDIDVQMKFRAFTIDPFRFPNLGGFIRELQQHGVQFVTILNPGVKLSRESNLFLEGCVLDAFCKLPDGRLVVGPVWPGWCVFPDFTKPAVRQWWSRQYEYLLDVGVAGFWHDMNEPAAFILWGDRSLPPRATQHHMEGRGGNHLEAHNLYGLLQTQAAYQSLRQHRPQQRPFLVSRAGWAGLQRYAWTWTGDIDCTWTALKQTIATVLGLGLSGIPYSGPDIGGFQGNPTAELYLRWFQMCSFVGFCRTHSANNVEDRTPWTYGEPTLSIIRQFLQLRYRLLPYFYHLAWEANQQGYPLVRPLFWADPQDARLWSIDDQFLLGDALLVCPILQAGQQARRVTLPQGDWYHFWDDEILAGQATLEAPLERIPLLVKAGSILPMASSETFNLLSRQRLTEQLVLHLYPDAQGNAALTLYTDAGDGDGPFRLDQFQLCAIGGGYDLTWIATGEFGFPYQTIQVQFHGPTVQQAWADGETVAVQNQTVTLTAPCQLLHLRG
jgi:alpha-glucosidase